MKNESKMRLLYIGKILYEETDEDNYLTTAQISKILEDKYGIHAHRTTVSGDIETLIEFGMDIQTVKSSQNKYNLVGRLFDNAELKTLIDAVVSSKFISKKKSELLSQKICYLAGKNFAKQLRRNIAVEGRVKTDNEAIFYIVDTINSAINTNKKISFKYFAYDIHKEKKLRHNGFEYIVSPYKLVWNGDAYYLVGYSEKHDTIANFRVDRIANQPIILESDIKPLPKAFNMDSYLNTMFRMFSTERCEVELICDNSVIDSIVDKFGEDVKILAYDMTSFKIIIDVALSNVFYSWVFGFGGKVIIKGPSEVKKQYEEMLRQAQYNK